MAQDTTEPDDPTPVDRPGAADSSVGTAAQVAQAARAAQAAEAARRLVLLWDPPPPPTRGRPARLTLDEVVAAGTAVAQEGGLEHLSMRKVAARLGVGAMSLYTYVPGRTELVDLMIDRAFGELDLPAPGGPWRPALARYADEHFALYQRHPWVLQTNLWRLPLAPHVLDAEECVLRLLLDAGLAPRQAVEIRSLVDSFVRGHARAVVAETVERAASGRTDDDYWDSMSSFWTDHFDPQRYPSMVRVWEAGGFDAGEAPFRTSLDRLLDAVETAVRGSTGGADADDDADDAVSDDGSDDGR